MSFIQDVKRDICEDIIALWLTHVCYERCHVWRSWYAILKKLHNGGVGLAAFLALIFWNVFLVLLT